MALPAIAIAATVGTTAYGVHEQKKAQEEQDAAANAALKAAEPPKLPNTASLAASMQQADIQARTAGGTILSQNRTLGDANTTGRKSLLGQ